MVFHFVSLVELFLSGHVLWASVHNGESLLAFFSMSFFMLVYAIYQTTSPGVVVFPIVFFLTFVAALDQQPVLLTSFVHAKDGWSLTSSSSSPDTPRCSSASAPACFICCRSAASKPRSPAA